MASFGCFGGLARLPVRVAAVVSSPARGRLEEVIAEVLV